MLLSQATVALCSLLNLSTASPIIWGNNAPARSELVVRGSTSKSTTAKTDKTDKTGKTPSSAPNLSGIDAPASANSGASAYYYIMPSDTSTSAYTAVVNGMTKLGKTSSVKLTTITDPLTKKVDMYTAHLTTVQVAEITKLKPVEIKVAGKTVVNELKSAVNIARDLERVDESDFQGSEKSANATLSERDLFGLNKRNTPTAEPGPSVSQSPSEVYLRVVSWGPTVPDLRKLSNYKYQTTAGQGIAVYVIDTGVNVQHKEYTGLAVTAQAPIDAQDVGGPLYKAGIADAKGHGSCAFSKVASPTYGVAKKVTMVAVKAQSTFEDTVKAFEAVLVDVLAKNRKGRAVVNLSRGIVGTSMTQQQNRLLRKAITNLIKSDVVVVCASGNSGSVSPRFNPTIQ